MRKPGKAGDIPEHRINRGAIGSGRFKKNAIGAIQIEDWHVIRSGGSLQTRASAGVGYERRVEGFKLG